MDVLDIETNPTGVIEDLCEYGGTCSRVRRYAQCEDSANLHLSRSGLWPEPDSPGVAIICKAQWNVCLYTGSLWVFSRIIAG